jgi:peptide/nickel transport system permease protein
MRRQYGLDKPLIEQYFVWVTGLIQGDLGFSFEYNLPVTEVVGDRLLLSMVLNFATILFIYVVSFPIGVYSATHQYSWGDYGLTLLGFLGLATPNFLLALIMLYFANVYFGTSVGTLMDDVYLNQPWSIDKAIRYLGHRRDDPPPEGQPAGRITEAICHHRACQGIAGGALVSQIPPAHGA